MNARRLKESTGGQRLAKTLADARSRNQTRTVAAHSTYAVDSLRCLPTSREDGYLSVSVPRHGMLR